MRIVAKATKSPMDRRSVSKDGKTHPLDLFDAMLSSANLCGAPVPSTSVGPCFADDGKVTLGEFQQVFLSCSDMTMDDVTELFNMFASDPVEPPGENYGSGQTESEKLFDFDDAYEYYYFIYHEAEHSTFKFIGEEEIMKIWNYLHTDLGALVRKIKGWFSQSKSA